MGVIDQPMRSCCPTSCRRCGGAGCGGPDGPGAAYCCPARFSNSTCTDPTQLQCKLPTHVVGCLNKVKGTMKKATEWSKPRENHSAKPGERRPHRACSCHGSLSRPYRGQCLPSFMIIGSQKAATSKLRWYMSRHPGVRIPKEENFHKGPPPVAAWDTETDPTLLTRFLDNLDDVCGTTSISGLKMPDYIVMSNLTIARFYSAAPTMRIVLTLREPIARMYSYFSMQLRLGWSPINHMGKNPCMQRRLKEIKQQKDDAAAARGGGGGRELSGGGGGGGGNGSSKSGFAAEDIMRTNLQCVQPCYGSGIARDEVWHNEDLKECRNIYFTPLVHSMYALHLRRWLQVFPRESLLLLRFDDLVLRPLTALQQLAGFLRVASFEADFKVEVGRANYTTNERLLQTGALTAATLSELQAYFKPHNEALEAMFPGSSFW